MSRRAKTRHATVSCRGLPSAAKQGQKCAEMCPVLSFAWRPLTPVPGSIAASARPAKPMACIARASFTPPPRSATPCVALTLTPDLSIGGPCNAVQCCATMGAFAKRPRWSLGGKLHCHVVRSTKPQAIIHGFAKKPRPSLSCAAGLSALNRGRAERIIPLTNLPPDCRPLF
jgi:hypothetical protein